MQEHDSHDAVEVYACMADHQLLVGVGKLSIRVCMQTLLREYVCSLVGGSHSVHLNFRIVSSPKQKFHVTSWNASGSEKQIHRVAVGQWQRANLVARSTLPWQVKPGGSLASSRAYSGMADQGIEAKRQSALGLSKRRRSTHGSAKSKSVSPLAETSSSLCSDCRGVPLPGHKAAYLGHIECLETLHRDAPGKLEMIDRNGAMPLHLAARQSNADSVK